MLRVVSPVRVVLTGGGRQEAGRDHGLDDGGGGQVTQSVRLS